MCREYNELEFTHFVVDSSDGSIFGSARINGSGKVANFIIRDSEVKQQSGDSWQPVEDGDAEVIRQHAKAAYGRVHTYRTERFYL